MWYLQTGAASQTGHTLLWQHPANYPMASVEYKVLPSGAHAAAEDYLYVLRNWNSRFVVGSKDSSALVWGVGTPDLLVVRVVRPVLIGQNNTAASSPCPLASTGWLCTAPGYVRMTQPRAAQAHWPLGCSARLWTGWGRWSLPSFRSSSVYRSTAAHDIVRN
jgi:hypothetical protein